MKALIAVSNLNTSKDRKKIADIITDNEGIIACEISLKRKEIAVIYDELSVSIEDIIYSIELAGYIIVYRDS